MKAGCQLMLAANQRNININSNQWLNHQSVGSSK
jgi:hypothetical protein